MRVKECRQELGGDSGCRAKTLVSNDLKALRDRIEAAKSDPVAQEKIRLIAEGLKSQAAEGATEGDEQTRSRAHEYSPGVAVEDHGRRKDD